jgi:hypothetical protein
MEYWNNGIMGFMTNLFKPTFQYSLIPSFLYSVIPSFHHSNVPVAERSGARI